MENVAKLNFQFLMGAPACSWASAAELGVRCLEPAGHLLPCPFLNSPLLLGFPLALDLGKTLDSPKTCAFSSWGGVAAMTAQLPVHRLPAGYCVSLSKWIPSPGDLVISKMVGCIDASLASGELS